MTDLEISKALALAIGWDDLWVDKHGQLWVGLKSEELHEGIFDYRDWNVIGPIAERYDAFPYKTVSMGWASNFNYADTPQKAIALAVIGAKK
jgi:hypothetical protein